MPSTTSPSLTIGRLARAAGVGVETIRYYQQRGLLPLPATIGAYRHYPVTLIERIRCWRALKTDQLCSLKIDQGWRPRA